MPSWYFSDTIWLGELKWGVFSIGLDGHERLGILGGIGRDGIDAVGELNTNREVGTEETVDRRDGTVHVIQTSHVAGRFGEVKGDEFLFHEEILAKTIRE